MEKSLARLSPQKQHELCVAIAKAGGLTEKQIILDIYPSIGSPANIKAEEVTSALDFAVSQMISALVNDFESKGLAPLFPAMAEAMLKRRKK